MKIYPNGTPENKPIFNPFSRVVGDHTATYYAYRPPLS